MSNKNRITLYSLLNIYFFLLFLNFSFFTDFSNAQELNSINEVNLQDKVAQETGKYFYKLEGRPDPFKPFISPVSTQPVDPNEIIEEEIELTGMQLFEPGQLTLVATMSEDSNRFAMVEDVTGRGYVLKKGMLIGRRGEVTDIGQQEIVITETSRTRAGKELKNTVVMRLKKEGEE